MKSNSPFYQDKCQVAWDKWEAGRMSKETSSLTKDTSPGTKEAEAELKEKGEYECVDGVIKRKKDKNKDKD